MVLTDDDLNNFKFARKPRNKKGVWTLERRIEASIRHRGLGKGRKLSEEAKNKLSEMRRGKLNPFYGKTHTQENREKIRQTHLGKKQTEEHKKKRAMVGEHNPAWKGGIAKQPYCEKFNEEFKRRVRAFFGNKCVVCGRTQESNGKDKRALGVHHVNYDKQACCNDSKPLFVVVCTHCHRVVHKEDWVKTFINLINDKYNGKCYYTKEEFKKIYSDHHIAARGSVPRLR